MKKPPTPPPLLTVRRNAVTEADQERLRTAGYLVVEVDRHDDVLTQESALSQITAEAAEEVLREIVVGAPLSCTRDTLALRWVRGLRRRVAK